MYLEWTRVGAKNWSSIERAATEWARSRRIEVMFVKRCPSSYYCVKVDQAHSSRRMAHPDATDYANLRRIYAGASHTERPQASPQAI